MVRALIDINHGPRGGGHEESGKIRGLHHRQGVSLATAGQGIRSRRGKGVGQVVAAQFRCADKDGLIGVKPNFQRGSIRRGRQKQVIITAIRIIPPGDGVFW